jgi:hypothetical protein
VLDFSAVVEAAVVVAGSDVAEAVVLSAAVVADEALEWLLEETTAEPWTGNCTL